MARHDFGLLLRDCHKLYTEWRTGETLTRRQASKASQTAIEGDVWRMLIEFYDVDLVKALALTAKMISRIPRRRVEHKVYKALPRREKTISFAEGIKGKMGELYLNIRGY